MITLSIPCVLFVVAGLGATVMAILIGPPAPPRNMFDFDFISPLLQIANLVFWIIVVLVGLLIWEWCK